MKNFPSYFNCNSDQTILTASSLEAVNVFLHTCAIPVKVNWSTVARMRQYCKVCLEHHLARGADMLLDAYISKLVFYVLDLGYVHFAEMVPSRLGSLPGPPPKSYFHLPPSNKNFYSLYHTHCCI